MRNWLQIVLRLALVGWSITTQVLPAVAQESAVPPAGYDEVIAAGLREYEAHNFAEARALFTTAHNLFPNARTLRGIGMAEFELKNYGESINRLEAALASPAKPLEGQLLADTQALLARAKAFVARFELELKPAPQNASIVVDGVPVTLAAGQALTLTVGEHVLQIEASGYRDAKRALSVKGGETQRLVIELRPQAQAAPVLATRVTPAKADASVWSSPWLWTGVGAVVAGGVLTAVVLASGSETKDPKPISGDIGGVVQTLRAR